MRYRIAAVLLGLVFGMAARSVLAAQGGQPPRLVVVVCVDQLRMDLVTRNRDLFLPAETDGKPGGFNHLLERGAAYVNAHHDHFPVVTAPGHAAVLTGAGPGRHGIIGNEWWDAAAKREVGSVEDSAAEAVGAEGAARTGPAQLMVSTVGDELRLATNGNAKVVAISLKDRPAVLMGGRGASACVWFETRAGRWASSTAYCKDAKLPEWAERVNGSGAADVLLGKAWETTLSAEVLAARTRPAAVVGSGMAAVFGAAFPHAIGSEKSPANYTAFLHTPAANAMVVMTAIAAVESEKLGKRGVTDLLAISLSANDYAGHTFGPESPEVLDITVATDRLLAKFLEELDAKVGLQNVVLMLTGDHGVAPVTEGGAKDLGLAVGRFSTQEIITAIMKGLSERFGEPPQGTPWFSAGRGKNGAFTEGYVYLNDELIADLIKSGKSRSRAEVQEAAAAAVMAARVPGVLAVYTKTQVMEGRIGDPALRDVLGRSVHPQRSGDLVVIQQPGWLPRRGNNGNATTHLTPFAYDTHVPVLVLGRDRVKPGVYMRRVAPRMIAPTLSLMLGINLPSGSEAEVLGEVVERK